MITSTNKFDDFLFGRNYENNIHKNESNSEHVKVKVKGSRHKNLKSVFSNLPPVPVELNPIPYQITPIGTIPIYFKNC
ncbi:hypothetical protein [Bacillus sp. AFS055030]|uniref:hypothetical protein n=1 Tax=Bacillus sp. AFS055030 TaxID=2033507 RepID=UPI000BFE0A03|nr:hypothetical protein [Bacillus sp. AFS055030]PGL71048.1 hypothetical protein CN925_09335 [Bacillus sp. AFS055030]